MIYVSRSVQVKWGCLVCPHVLTFHPSDADLISCTYVFSLRGDIKSFLSMLVSTLTDSEELLASSSPSQSLNRMDT